MKEKRIISSVIYFALLLSVLVLNNALVDTLVVVIVSVISMHEYIRAFRSVGYHPIPWVGYLGCLSICLLGAPIDFATKMLILRIGIPALVIMAFIYIIIKNLKVTVIDVALTVFSLVYVPFMFSFIKLILSMPNGRIYIWLVILGAFMSDIFAYIIGSKLGKHKLCPSISPKKSVEGSVAGVIGVVISYVIFTVVVNQFFHMDLNIFIMILMGVVTAIVGQFGDLSASSIKRYCGVKDFGSIMPGHGGMLDRCDSILFVAPVVYMFIKVFMLG